MSSSTTPCAACKFLRRKCTQNCVFAPYFPANQPHKFASVHNVFGASNVAKLLSAIPLKDRADFVNSLVYDAEARLRDPIYGSVGVISVLQTNLKQMRNYLANAKQELATYVGPSGMMPTPGYMAHQHQSNPYSTSGVTPYNMSQMIGSSSGGAGTSHGNALVIRDPQQHMIEAQQSAAAMAAREQQWLISQQLHAVNHPHPQQEFASGVTSAVLGGIDNNPYQIQQQQPQQEHLPHHQQHHSHLQTQHLMQLELQLQQPQQQLEQDHLPHHQHHHSQLRTHHLLQSELQLQQPQQQLQQEHLPHHQHHHSQLQTQHLMQSELQLKQPQQQPQQEHLPHHQHHHSQLQTQQYLLQSDQLHAVNHPQQEFASGSSAGFYPDGPPSHFIQTTTPGVTSAVLGGIDNNPYQIQQQQPQQEHLPHHHSQLQTQHLMQSELQLQQPQLQLQQDHLPHHQHHHSQLQTQHLMQSELQLQQPQQQLQQEHLPHHQHHPQLQTQHLLQSDQLQPHQQPQQYQQQQEHQNHHRQLQVQHLLQLEQQQLRQPHHKRSGSDQGRSLGPSS